MDKAQYKLVEKANRLGWSNAKLGKKIIEMHTGIKGGADELAKSIRNKKKFRR